MQDDLYGQQFNMPPGGGIPEPASPEQIEMANQYENGNPPFAGDAFGNANENNNYYGEKPGDGTEAGEEFNKGVSDAAALINYGLDAAARERGVEFVVQTIKGFSGTTVEELFNALGIDTPKEYEDTRDEAMAARANVAEFREGVNAPSQKRSPEGFLKAIQDMKELILEVEGADPRYAELRAGAKAAGKGYFEYAVSNFGTRGLTELFKVLAAQREQATVAEEKPEESKELGGIENSEETEETRTPDGLEKAESPEEKRKREEDLINKLHNAFPTLPVVF